jgi:hypothetical protein
MTTTANGSGAKSGHGAAGLIDPPPVLAAALQVPPQRLRDRLPRSRRQRRPAVAAVGLMLIVLFATVGAALAVRADHSVAVLALTRDVPAGHVVTSSDLRVAHISGSGVSALAGSSAGTVVGETVTASLPAGTLLSPGMLSHSSSPPNGEQVVAVALKPGAVPAGVAAGRDVDLVPVVLSTARSTAVPTSVFRARVLDVMRDTTSGAVVVSVEVDAAAAAQVAQLAASGALAMTLLPVAP